MTNESHREEGTENRIRSDLGPFSMVPIWIHHYNLGSGQLAVYCVLARFATMGNAFPSIATIGREAHKSRTQVYEALRGLESKGLLRRHPRFDKNGRQTSSESVLAMGHDPFPQEEQLSLDAQVEGGCGFPEGGVFDSGNPDETEGGGCGFPTGGRVRVSDTPGVEEKGVEGSTGRSASGSVPTEPPTGSTPETGRNPSYRELMFVALSQAHSPGCPLPRSQRSFVGKIATTLCGDKRKPEEVPARYAAGRQRFDNFSIAGLPKWWDDLEHPAPAKNGNGRRADPYDTSPYVAAAEAAYQRDAQRSAP